MESGLTPQIEPFFDRETLRNPDLPSQTPRREKINGMRVGTFVTDLPFFATGLSKASIFQDGAGDIDSAESEAIGSDAGLLFVETQQLHGKRGSTIQKQKKAAANQEYCFLIRGRLFWMASSVDLRYLTCVKTCDIRRTTVPNKSGISLEKN